MVIVADYTRDDKMGIHIPYLTIGKTLRSSKSLIVHQFAPHLAAFVVRNPREAMDIHAFLHRKLTEMKDKKLAAEVTLRFFMHYTSEHDVVWVIYMNEPGKDDMSPAARKAMSDLVQEFKDELLKIKTW